MLRKMRNKTKQKRAARSSQTTCYVSFNVLQSSEGRKALIHNLVERHELRLISSDYAQLEPDSIRCFVIELARSKHVFPQLTNLDQIASTFTVLAGEQAKRDEVSDLLVALGHNHILSSQEIAQLSAAYVAEAQE